MFTQQSSLKPLLAGSALALGLLVSGQSMAASVVYEEVGTIANTEVDVLKLGNLEAGEYSLTVNDLGFPAPMTALSAQLSTATEVLGSMQIVGEGEESVTNLNFPLDQAGTYYLTIFGTADSQYGVGTYGVRMENLDAEPAPVPLPLPAFLFLSGLGALAVVRRRNS